MSRTRPIARFDSPQHIRPSGSIAVISCRCGKLLDATFAIFPYTIEEDMRWFLSLGALLLAGCGLFGGADYAPLDTVPSVDLARYVGKWYEIASLPVSQQKGCSCTTAEYSVMGDGVIRVVNRCRKGEEMDEAEGKAFVVEGAGNAKLRVQFFWPFRGDYWVIDLAEDYSYAIVGTPSRKYFWILSRTPSMAEDTLQTLVGKLQARGFDTTQMQRTVHDCGT